MVSRSGTMTTRMAQHMSSLSFIDVYQCIQLPNQQSTLMSKLYGFGAFLEPATNAKYDSAHRTFH